MLQTVAMTLAESRMMSNIEAPAARRRLPVSLLLAIIGAIVALLIFGALHSPLNPTERYFVGEWTFVDTGDPRITRHIFFHQDRTFELRTSTNATGTGSWKITDDSLHLTLDPEETMIPTSLRTLSGNRAVAETETFSMIGRTPDRASVRNALNETIDLQRMIQPAAVEE